MASAAPDRTISRFVGSAALAAAYFGAGRLSLGLHFVDNVAPVWPATGIALAALLLYGVRLWPGVAAGAFLVNAISGPIGAAAGMAVGNTLEAVAAALLLQRAGFRPALDHRRDILRLFAAAVATAPLSATFGVVALTASGAVVTLAEAWERWLTWSFGDAVGVVTAAPAILTVLARPRQAWTPARIGETVAVLGLLAGVGALLFLRGFPSPYLVFPFLVWAAVRLGPRGAALATLVVWSLTVWFAGAAGATSTMRGDIINLLAFTSVAGATALLLAAVAAERQRAAEEQGRTLSLLQGVVSGSGDAIFVKDLEGRYLMVNAPTARVFGRTPGESVGLTDLDLLPENQYCRIVAADRAVLATGKARTLEERVILADGRTLDFLTTKAPYRDAAGRVIGVIGVARDITEMKRTEERLRESEEKYRSVVESAADYISLLDRDGRFVFINRVAKGFDRDRVIGASMYDYLPPVDRPAVRKTIEDVVRTGQPATYEVQGLGYDGAPSWYRCTVGPVLKDGEVVSVTVIANDITDRVRMEGRLRKSEAQFRSVVASVPDFVHTLDRDGRIIFANRGAEGLDVSDLVGGFAWDHVAPEDRARMREAVAAVFRTGAPETLEVRGQVGGRARGWYLCRVCPVVEVGRVDRAVLVAQDITESRVREEELRTSRERLRRLSRRLIEAQETERGHIARELHDEIGQALTAVKMSLQAAVRKGPGASLDDSIALVDGALGQVRDLSVALRPSLLDELGLVPALRWYLSQQAQRVGFAPRFEADPEIGAAPDVETACFRIAQEALTNVARHAEARSVSLEVKQSHDELELVVRDDGKGFDADGVFERTGTDRSLGLHGMRERARLLGGRVTVESKPERGTVVRARFPLEATP